MKCSYCAEEILDDAIKCKHCGSIVIKTNFTQKQPIPFVDKGDKVVLKLIGKILLVVIAIAIWYVSIPAVIVYCVWKKTKWDKKKKYIGTALAAVLLCLLVGLYTNISRAPSIVITEPIDGFAIQADKIKLKGTIDPKDATLDINGAMVNIENGTFIYQAELTDEKNIFTLKASNSHGESQQQIMINRTFTEAELAEREKQKVEDEAKKQAAIVAQKKVAKEREAKLLAEEKAWEQSKAGRLCKKYPTWTKDECKNVADGQIWVGMGYDMLVVVYGGKPNVANPSNYGSGTQWQYCWTYYASPSCFYDNNDDGIIDSYN